jgi:hypothetical protein
VSHIPLLLLLLQLQEVVVVVALPATCVSNPQTQSLNPRVVLLLALIRDRTVGDDALEIAVTIKNNRPHRNDTSQSRPSPWYRLFLKERDTNK